MAPLPSFRAPGMRAHRRGRAERTRAVSPLIATILLVAIAVVFASVLYVLVSGTLVTPSKPPLGDALALGPATPLSGSPSTSSYCAHGRGCYAVSFANAATTLAVGDLGFALLTTSGVDHKVTKGSGMISLVNPSGKVIAKSPSIAVGKPLEVTSWIYSSGYSSSTPITSELTLWIEFGTAVTNPANHGFYLQAFAVNAFEGAVLYELP